MDAFEFMGKHPILSFFMAEMVVVNTCKLINNVALYKAMGSGAIEVDEDTEDENIEEVTEE